MNISNQYAVTIFRRDYEGRTLYQTGLSKKRQDGSYENGYIPVQFKKGVELDNQTKIYIKNAWLTFYKNKDNKDIHYIFINEFNLVEEEIKQAKKEVEKEQSDPFKEFGSEVQLTDDDLPF